MIRALRSWGTDDDDEEVPSSFSAEGDEAPPYVVAGAAARAWGVAIGLLALMIRLAYLFRFTDPQNPGEGLDYKYGDVYSHWQIAYLTREIGLFHGPRLWDLNAHEYFWGVLHPVLLAALFTLTGSIDLVVARLLSLAFGVIVVVLVFLICSRHWGLHAGLASAAFAALAPPLVFNDVAGNLETLVIAFCLAAVWWAATRPRLAGIALTLAAMTRPEGWLYGIGLAIAGRVAPGRARGAMLAAFAVSMVLYCGLLWLQTGNPFYPLYVNFFTNVTGQYASGTGPDVAAWTRPFFAVTSIGASTWLAWTLRRRPRGYLYLVFGLGYVASGAGLLAFTHHWDTFLGWIWYSRTFMFGYDFAASLAAVALLYWLPRRLGHRALLPGYAVAIGALLAVQLSWFPFQGSLQSTAGDWHNALGAANAVSAVYTGTGRSGAIAVPSDRPSVTYALVRDHGLDAKQLVSERYDPVHGGSTSAREYSCWLARNGVHYVVVPTYDNRYMALLKQDPAIFKEAGYFGPYYWLIERVTPPACP